MICSQSGAPHRIESIARGKERLSCPLDGGREPGELCLRLVEQRPEPLSEPVEIALDPYELVLGPVQLTARPRGDRGFQIVPVEIMRVDGGDVPIARLVDPLPQRGEVVHGPAGPRRTVDGADRLDRDPQIALGGVQLVEGGGRGILRGLRIGPVTLTPPAEPAPRPPLANVPGSATAINGRGSSTSARTSRTALARACALACGRACVAVIPLPCCVALPGSFSHQVRTNTRAR